MDFLNWLDFTTTPSTLKDERVQDQPVNSIDDKIDKPIQTEENAVDY